MINDFTNHQQAVLAQMKPGIGYGVTQLARMLNCEFVDGVYTLTHRCEWCPVLPPRPGTRCAVVSDNSRQKIGRILRSLERKGRVRKLNCTRLPMYMVSPRTMTCTELYTCDPTFAAGVNSWVANRRCPFGLGDYLAGLDMPQAAACAWWAESEPDRHVFLVDIEPCQPREPCGPFPLRVSSADNSLGGTDRWVWNGECDHFAHDALGSRIPKNTYFPTPLAAILALLDAWKAAPA